MSRLVSGFVAALGLGMLLALPAQADSASVMCVQDQLLALDYDVGGPDGKLGRKSMAAAEAYMTMMKGRDANWALVGLSEDTAREWCESVADAWPQARPYWDNLKAIPTANVVNPSLDESLLLNVVMDKKANFQLAVLKGNKTLWTSEEVGAGAGSWSLNVPGTALQEADRFCVYLQKGWVVRDKAGKKFSGSCEPVTDATRGAAQIYYQLAIEPGQAD